MSFDLKIVSGDLSLDNGDLAKLTGTLKLIQDILKIVLTPVSGNPSFPWYGSYISRNIIGNVVDSEVMQNIGTSQLISAIQNLQNLQKVQAGTFQTISPEEHIAAISNVSLERNNLNPTLYEASIKVLTKALTPVQSSFSITTI